MGEKIEATPEEERAIRALKRLAKTWPDTLWLFSASGSLLVMRKGPHGEHVEVGRAEGIDPSYELAQIDIENDGGDW